MALATALGTALVAAAGSSYGAFPGTNGSIVFDNGGVISTVRSDGSEIRPLRRGINPSYSPSGRKIVFEVVGVQDEDEVNRIYKMDADGRDPRLLTTVARVSDNDSRPSWSPSGKRIAFAKPSGIYKMNADGRDAERVTRGPDTEPVWSPRGDRIAFSGSENSNEIYTVKPDGSARERLTDGLQAGDTTPDWSPDGREITFDRLAFDSDRNDDFQVWVMDADGTDERRLTSFETSLANAPAFSPDGSRIVFERFEPFPAEDYEIWTMAADGTDQRKLTDGPGFRGSPDWRPR